MFSPLSLRERELQQGNLFRFFQEAALLTIDTDRVAALEILLHGLLADKRKLFHAFLHLIHTTAQENQQGFNLLRRGTQFQYTLLSDIQGLLNLLDTIRILINQIAQLETAERQMPRFILSTQPEDGLFHFVLGNEFPKPEQRQHAAFPKQVQTRQHLGERAQVKDILEPLL